MIEFASKSEAKEFVVATELGMLNALKLKVPGKKFYPLVSLESCACARCPYMAMITLEKVYNSLKDMVYEVKVDPKVAERARQAFENTVKLLESLT
jgi:quinolinate synthase